MEALRTALPSKPAFQASAPSVSFVFRDRSFDLFSQLVESFTVKLDRIGTPAYARNAKLIDRLETFIQHVLPISKSSERWKSRLAQSALFEKSRVGRDPTLKALHLDHAVYEQLRLQYHGTLLAQIRSQIASLQILIRTRKQIGGELRD